MIRLSIPTDNSEIDLGHGVTAVVRPISTAVYEAALITARRQVQDLVESSNAIRSAGGTVTDLGDLADPDFRGGVAQMLFCQALARHAIVSWENVEAAEGGPAPVTAENVDRLLAIPAVATRFLAGYLAPIDALSAEGNA